MIYQAGGKPPVYKVKRQAGHAPGLPFYPYAPYWMQTKQVLQLPGYARTGYICFPVPLSVNTAS